MGNIETEGFCTEFKAQGDFKIIYVADEDFIDKAAIVEGQVEIDSHL
jgi:hypothetical protein